MGTLLALIRSLLGRNDAELRALTEALNRSTDALEQAITNDRTSIRKRA